MCRQSGVCYCNYCGKNMAARVEEQHSCKSGKTGGPLTSPIIRAYLPGVRHSIETMPNLEGDLIGWPTSLEIVEEARQIGGIAGSMVVAGLLTYFRGMISMLFLGRLGEVELAGGSLAIGFANITAYSVLSGLAMGMEPICSQAYGAKQWNLMALTLQRMILILLFACIPISLLWTHMDRILLLVGQDTDITSMAATYLLFALPDLPAQALLNPLKIYLRTQEITLPLTLCAAISLALHAPINFFLVSYLGLGIRGVALAVALADFNLVLLLFTHLYFSGTHSKFWHGWSTDCFKEWPSLLRLAVPSCVSVCLEWWWYELMTVSSGLLENAKTAVATMGVLIQTTSLVYIFPSSLSQAVSTRIGNELGANRPHKARIAMMVALCLSLLLGVVAMSMTTAMRHVWARMFTQEESIISLTALAMPIVGICELGNCPQTTGCGVLRGSARPSTGASINLRSFYMVGMPIAILLAFIFNLGFVGLWLGLLAAQATCASLMFFVLLRTDWDFEALRAKQLTRTESSTTYRVEGDEKEALISVTVVQPEGA